MSIDTIDQRLKQQAAAKLDKDLDAAFSRVIRLIGDKFAPERLACIDKLKEESRALLLPEYEKRELDEFMERINSNEKPKKQNVEDWAKSIKPVEPIQPRRIFPYEFIPAPQPHILDVKFPPGTIICRTHGDSR